MAAKTAVFVVPRFERDTARLYRRSRHIYADVALLVKHLEAGETPGQRVKGISQGVYKVHLPDTRARRSKKADFRFIYYLSSAAGVYLLTIYAKSDEPDIRADVVRRIVEEELRAL
jgi:mRNA-degrading endonuclease RelE of RelBE toxin-antitoxin system